MNPSIINCDICTIIFLVGNFICSNECSISYVCRSLGCSMHIIYCEVKGVQYYSSTSLFRVPMGPVKVALIVRWL